MPKPIVDPEKLRQLIEAQGLQQWKAAEMLGVSVSCVERSCKRLGLKTQRTGPRQGPGHPDWKGGRYLVDRYWYVWAPWHPNCTKTGYIAEHRLRMTQKLGRPLEAGEVVHHMDGNPRNNDPANLMVFGSNAEHLQHELVGRIPAWTPEGMERMQAGIERSAILRRGIKRDGSKHSQTTDHQTSEA